MARTRPAPFGCLIVVAAVAAAVRAEDRLALKSSAFADGTAIPSSYTCDGDDRSPPIAWSGVPARAKSLALIVDDPDAPNKTWVHWVVYDLPSSASELAEGAGAGDLPAGAKQGVNDWSSPRYRGPCPPSGRHRYVFKLYALDTVLPDLGAPSKPQLERAMKGHIVVEGRLTGTYERTR
ncbi:MAG TPA: YbhB/YbcL family Raf kinase inhibitor-like protein [Myxococcota bacterium]|nr:YbhB/YbcL family Raf kinase inhibitor-like protein [Myxococcota bacterium]